MKNLFVILIVLIGLGFNHANGQNLQRTNYNDGKVLVFIKKEGHQFAHNCGSNANDKHDKLLIENICDRAITIKYSYKAVLYNCNDVFQKEEIKYREVTLQPGDKKSESGYLSNGYTGYYFVDSFSVIYVK